MNVQHLDLVKDLVNPNYILQAEQARNSRSKRIASLLSQRRLPDEGWDEDLVQQFLEELASFDTNNFQGNVGVGEREGRVICDLVRRRHFGLTHGIGRSGDVMADQPKAAGSSLIVQLTRYLVLDAIHLAGIKAAKTCAVLPAATGLTMTLVFLALRQLRPRGKYVVWSRIDQKSCFKAIGAAGLIPIVIELVPIEGTDAIGTDVPGIRAAIERVSAEEVLCICTTTSTFAPRVPDSIDEVALLAKELDVPHVINNAYGLQCSKCTHLIETGCRQGRVDAFVQSTDKNFLVPVGGAIVAAPKGGQLVDKVSNIYPGRASMSPLLDVLITLLSLGGSGWKKLLQQRKENMVWFQEQLTRSVEKMGLRLLRVPANKISLAIDVLPLARTQEDGQRGIKDLTFLGSALFTRRVSGPRVVVCDLAAPPTPALASEPIDENTESAPSAPAARPSGKYKKSIDGISFESYGAHANTYQTCYLTAACALGASREELVSFIERLEQAVQDYRGGDSSGGGKKNKNEKKPVA